MSELKFEDIRKRFGGTEALKGISFAVQSGKEVATLRHRALVFNRGAIVAEIDGPALTTEALIAAASMSEAA